MSILSELLWSTLGIVYVPAKIIKEERDAKKHEAEFEQRYGGAEQFDLMLKTTEELSALLDFPIEDIPLTDGVNFVTGELSRTRTARERRNAYAVAAILRKRGKRFLPVDPLDAMSDGREFLAYVNGWKKLPKEIVQERLELWDKRNRRFRELETISDLNKEEFEKILGRELLSFNDTIFDADSCGSSSPILWFDQYKAMAIAEILEREQLPSLTYSGIPVPYNTRKEKLDRVLELATMEFPELEKLCGFTFSDATVATRKKAIDLICDKGDSEFEKGTDLYIDTDTSAIDMGVLYEYLRKEFDEEAEAKRKAEQERAEREQTDVSKQLADAERQTKNESIVFKFLIGGVLFAILSIQAVFSIDEIETPIALLLWTIGLVMYVAIFFLIFHIKNTEKWL